MNEEAIDSAFTLFSEAGYNKDKASYLKLIQENEDALSDSFSLFKEAGYKNDINNFKNLMGFEVEDEVEVVSDPKKEKGVDAENVIQGFDSYLEALSNENYRDDNIKDNDSRLAEIEKVKKEKDNFNSTINKNPGILEAANDILSLDKDVTEEEIKAEEVVSNSYFDDFAIQRKKEGKSFYDDDRKNKRRMQELLYGEGKTGAENDPIKNEFNQYAASLMDITNAAKELGLKPTSDKEKAKKDKSYTYIPDVSSGNIDEISLEVLERANYNQKKKQAKEGKFQAIKPELDKKLNEFEEKFGATNAEKALSLVKTLGQASTLPGIAKVGVQKYLGIPDKEHIKYTENRNKLYDLISSGEKASNYKLKSTLYNIGTSVEDVASVKAELQRVSNNIKNNTYPTQADYDKYNSLIEELKIKNEAIDSQISFLNSIEVESDVISEIAKETQKTYETLDVYQNNIASSTVRLAAGLGNVVNETLNPVNLLEWTGYDLNNEEVRNNVAGKLSDITGVNENTIKANFAALDKGDQSIDKALNNLSGLAEEIKQRNRDPQRFDEINTIGEFASWTGEMLSDQVVNTGMSIVMPGYGLILSAASEAGNKMHEMKTEVDGTEWDESTKAYIQEFKKEFGTNPFGIDADDNFMVKPKEYNALQFFATAGVYGAAEYYSEKIALKNFGMGSKNLKKAFDLAKKSGADDIIFSNTGKTNWGYLKDFGKDWLRGGVEESVGEGSVALAGNFMDRFILGKTEVSMLDGVTESMVSGFVMNSAFQSPAIAGQVYNAFRPEGINAKVAATGAEMVRLSKIRDDYNLRLGELQPGSKEHTNVVAAKQTVEDQIHDLAKEQLENYEKTSNDIVALTKQDRQSLVDIFNREHKLRDEIDGINSNPEYDEKTKAKKISALQKKLVVENAFKERVLANSKWNADKARSSKFANMWRAKTGTLNQVVNIAGDNNTDALEQGLKHVDNLDNLTAEEKNQVKDQMKAEFERAKQESKGDFTVHGMAFGDNITVQTKNADGSTSSRKVNIPMNFAMSRANANVQSHEMGHQTVFKEFMQNNPNAIGLVSDMESYIKKNFKGKILQELKEVEEAYKDRSKAEVAEEKLARISDFLRGRNMKGDRTLHNKLFGRFQKFNDGSSQQINTGKDVFDMITSYNQSFETGTLTGLTKMIAEGRVETDKKPRSTRRSMTKTEQNKVEDDLNDAPGVRDKDGKYTMTKAEWRADKNRAFSKAYNMLMKGDLDGLIIAKMASGKDIYGESREQFLSDARDKIGQHMLNFDPQGRDSLFGWVNSYIGRKVGDVAKKAKRQKEKTPGKKISTDQKLGEEGRTVAETIEGDTASDIEAAVDRSLNAKKKGIDNLRTRLGIEKGGKIYNKVVDSVKKVFGAKLPEVSNKNFKEALKKDFNTLLFKDIKNDIGTRAKYKEFIEGNITFKDADGNTKTMPRWEMLYDYISQSTFNKRFEPFIEPLINPETGKPLRPDNNPLFTKKKITKQQWVDYFLGDNVQASTKGTRKDALASAIAQELAFDATMETISDPDIQNRIKDIYESQGLRQAENYLEQVAKEIDRVPDSKFSITKDIPVDVNQPKYLVQDALENLKNYLENENTGILSNRPVREIINDFRKTINSTQDSILEPLFEAIEDKISSSTNPDPDSLSSYEYAAKLRDSIIGEILFENLDSSPKPATAFKDLIFSKLSKKQQENYQKPYTTNARNKPLDADQTKEFTEGIEDLGRFLPDDLKNNTGILTSLAGSNNIRTEQKVKKHQERTNALMKKGMSEADAKKNNKIPKSITNKEVEKLLNKSKNNKKSEVSNSNVTTPNWGGKTGISQSVDNLINDPNFDRNNPKDLAKLKKLIDAKYPASKAKELQEVGEVVINALNEMVNSYTPFSPKWWKAFNFAQNVIAAQTNATNGIFRQMAGLNAISLLSGTKAAFQIEHNVQSGKFSFNALNYIFLEAQAKIQNKNFDFKKELSRLSNMFNRNMMLLDKDIQVVADAKAGSKTFNKGLEVLKKKYGEKWLTPGRLQRIKDIAGSTTNQAGFNPNMDTLVNNVLAFGIASTTFDTKSGLTYDQVLINQMQGSLAHDLVSKIIEKNIKKSTMGKQVLESKNISKTIKVIPEANELFNEMISESAQLQVNPSAENNINENSIKLSLIDSNFDSYKKRNEENNKLSENAPINKFSKTKDTNKENIDELGTVDKALDVARDPKAPIKKIRVFDFDDTLATTKSDVLYTAPDGTNGKLNAEEFATQGKELLDQGYKFDFSEFNKVTKGKPGPLLDIAKKIQAARGTEDVFVLTARAPEAQAAIKEFLDSVGLNIPIENITGLGNSTGEAKAQWLVGKAAEGYNDFYFADDAIQNVEAVKKAMSVLDVKSKVQQAKAKFSKTVDKTINDIIEHKTGIKSESEYSDVKARLKGRKKGRFEIFIPPSAEDFVGLLYKMLGKGEIGNMQMDWFKEHLIEPYGRAMENLSRDQNRMINDFKALKNQLVKEGLIPKNLNKIAFGEYTLQNVARVLAWNKQGFDIPGISKTDLKQILDYAKKNPAIDVFAQNLIDINKGDGYAAPNADWLGGTISTDLLDGLRTGKRSKYLQQWQENVDIIFSPKNLNKMEAAFGTKYREAMEDILGRMKSGRNRSNKMGRLENRLLDYINNSVGTVMFFNDRSALLQLISSINFIDFGSNNVFKAAKAFANQKQYWSDFMELMNSEFLVERRNGLKLNVSESEIADAAANSKNKAKAAVAWILQKGYLPTQIADSFAIASGGATFYRNRIDALMKEGMSEADAKKKAFLEFREIAEESQQSSRPDRVSQQQASVLGRLVLAFQNTPMQMNRLGKKAFLDLVNRRKRPGMTQFQSDMSNVSRVTYYFAIQSAIFSSLQQALFALAFNDDEEESEKERYYNVANGMLNTFLNGTGIMGVAASTLISVARKVYKESAKEGQFPGPNYEDAANEMLNFSPPIDIKLSKLRQAGLTWKYEGYKHDEANWGIDDPAYKSAAYVISGLTNVPLDRLISKSENVRSAIEDEQQTWKRVSLLLGWRDYQLNSTEERKEYVTSQKEAKKKYREKMKNRNTRQYSPKTLEEQRLEQDRIKYKKLNQAEQVKKLDSLGLSKKQIRSLKYEKDRVAKLIELMNK